MWFSFFFVLYAILCLGFMFQKKMYDDCDMDGSSSCLCCTLLKGNCLEGHQNLKGIVYGVIKISPSIDSVMPFSPPLQRKRDAFAKVFMLHKPSFDIRITKFLIILNSSVQCDVR